MKRMQMFLLVVAVAVVLSGCAATDMRLRGSFNQAYLNIPEVHMKDYANKDVSSVVLGDLLLEPFDSVGIKETPALLRGEFSCFKVPFSKELKSEQYIPERIKWFVLVASQGYEYLGQLIKEASGEAELLVDGTSKVLKDAKALVLATRAEKVFGLGSDGKGVEVNRSNLMSDMAYRQELIEKYGTSLSDFEKSSKLTDEISQWNRFNSPRGYILTPLDEKRFREIVSINPGYTYSQRLANQSWIISTNVVGMVLQDGIVNHINAAVSEPNTEWKSKDTENVRESER